MGSKYNPKVTLTIITENSICNYQNSWFAPIPLEISSIQSQAFLEYWFADMQTHEILETNNIHSNAIFFYV